MRAVGSVCGPARRVFEEERTSASNRDEYSCLHMPEYLFSSSRPPHRRLDPASVSLELTFPHHKHFPLLYCITDAAPSTAVGVEGRRVETTDATLCAVRCCRARLAGALPPPFASAAFGSDSNHPLPWCGSGAFRRYVNGADCSSRPSAADAPHPEKRVPDDDVVLIDRGGTRMQTDGSVERDDDDA